MSECHLCNLHKNGRRFFHEGEEFSVVKAQLLTGETVPKIILRRHGSNATNSRGLVRRARLFCQAAFGRAVSFTPLSGDEHYSEFVLNAELS